MVEYVECACRKAEARGFLRFIRRDSEVVTPAQIEVYIRRIGLGVARNAVGPGIKQVVAVAIGSGENAPGAAIVGENAGRKIQYSVGIKHGIHAETIDRKSTRLNSSH